MNSRRHDHYASNSAPAPFIVGVGRSGTTLLRLMLDAHPDLAIPGETHFLVNLLAPEARTFSKDQVFNSMTKAATWKNLAVDAAAFRDQIDKLHPFSTAAAVRLFYRLYADRFGKRRWGDKTPHYRGRMAEINRLLAEAHFIHIIRDGRDVALSYRGLWFGPGDDIEAQARFWVDEITIARRQSTEVKHYIELHYEDLVADPTTTLNNACKFLGLSFHPRMLEYHKFAATRLAEHAQPFGPPGKTPNDLRRFMTIYDNTKNPPDRSRIGRWRFEMPEPDRNRYEAIAGPLLHELGYETSRGGR